VQLLNIKNFYFKLTHWESWHYMAKYIPIMPVWAWHCMRAGSPWFFTTSNPTLTFGGFEGETKSEMCQQLPPGSYPKSILITNGISGTELCKMVAENEFTYPFAVKPDAGMMGFMFRKIENKNELIKYHAAMPVNYILQELSDYPLEVSVFYYRHPAEKKGSITGFIKKEFLQVVGDGASTLLQLILNYQRVRLRVDEMKAKHANNLHTVLPKGAIFILSYALNLSRGGRLVSLAEQKDERLLKVFDDLADYTKHFYYGRYDIKCASVESLKSGKDFTILEYNGCGAEPHHAYGNGNTLLQAYSIFLHHWRILYRISVYNHKEGHKYWKLLAGWKYMRKAKAHYRMLKKLDGHSRL
jgi:hypothetical protein